MSTAHARGWRWKTVLLLDHEGRGWRWTHHPGGSADFVEQERVLMVSVSFSGVLSYFDFFLLSVFTGWSTMSICYFNNQKNGTFTNEKVVTICPREPSFPTRLLFQAYRI